MMYLLIICSCVPNFAYFFKTYPVNELLVLSDDCRYLVLLAKIQNKVDKNEEALLSLQRVSGSSYMALLRQFVSNISQDYFRSKLTAVPEWTERE